MDTRRLILFVIFSFSIMMLWDAWQHKDAPTLSQSTQLSAPSDLNKSSTATEVTQANVSPENVQFKLDHGNRIKVKTDLYEAEIDTTGGDLRRLVLNKHLAANQNDGHFVLMNDDANAMIYVAQSGLLGDGLPNHKSQFTSEMSSYTLPDNANSQEVRLSWTGNGIEVAKIYTFHRGSYVIDVSYQIYNDSTKAIAPSAYYQIVHDNKSNQGSKFQPTFTGGAYFTDETKYKKVKFTDMAKENLSKSSNDGWIGIVQHYFASAWIPQTGIKREFYTKQLTENVFAVGVVSPAGNIGAGAKAVIDAKLFAGPQTKDDLAAAAKGLEYTVDYGWLTVIAKPLFWLLSKIHSLVNNWGVSIILLTLLIKASFFRLSAASYRSMAQMRELAPRLQVLKEKYGDDKQKLQQAMMEMYKTEKINPLSGCLPILMQMPVFIALYWMLSAVVELRHAPFFGWIHDLSAPDTFFGTLPVLGGMPIGLLPLLMGATMIIQTTLNPAPTDPVQAKVMKVMPIIFSIFFFFFPAGLVLYWLVNNILSIAQQWYINKMIHAEATAKKANLQGSGKR